MNEVFEGEKEGSFLLLCLTGRRVKKEKGRRHERARPKKGRGFVSVQSLFVSEGEGDGKTTLSVLT